jgi:lipopolysaccharide transport system ATP-binding protein
VGTGFHGELTGRENIFLNGAILGMGKAEIKRKFDEIVAFSGVEKFLDTPVKRYSSGMYVRLAFAVAAHLEPEILIVDEVLAVGDAEFQKKCLGKMQDVATKEGRTVLFVSHNMAAVDRLCRTALLLEKGSVVAHGDTASVVAKYLQTDAGEKTQFIPDPAKPVGNDTVQLLGLTIKGDADSMGPSFASSVALKVEITYRLSKPAPGFRIGFLLHGADGTIVFNAADTDNHDKSENFHSRQPGSYMSVCNMPEGLLNRGQYSISVGSDSSLGGNFFCENVVNFFIMPDNRRDAREENRPGMVCPRLSWDVIAMDHSTGMPDSTISI